MEMIRQKVYQLEQAQIKMKAEYVAIPSSCPVHILSWHSTDNSVFTIATKPRSACYDTSSNRVACNLSPLISRLRSIRVLRRNRLLWVTGPATYLVVSCPTKEVVVPVLPLPHPWISSLPSMPFNHSLLRPPSLVCHNRRRARLEDIRLALL